MKEILAVVGLAALAYVWIRVSLQRLRRSFERVEARLEMVEHHRVPGTLEKTLQLLDDPTARVKFTVEERAAMDAGNIVHEREFLTGRWNQWPVRVELLVDGLKLEVSLKDWPNDLKLFAPWAARGAEGTRLFTGDQTFDAAINVRVRVANDSWRVVLTSEVRRLFVSLFRIAGSTALVHDGVITVAVGPTRTRLVEKLLDVATGVAGAIPPTPSDLHAGIFEAARVEPNPSVRFGHYCWLIDVAWNPAAIYRAAASDTDPEIAAWGRAGLPPAGGAFR